MKRARSASRATGPVRSSAFSAPVAGAGSRRVCGTKNGRSATRRNPAASSSAVTSATTVFRAIYYADDRAAFFARVAGFTEKKLVFDLNPRQFHVADVTSDLEVAGFRRIELRPFFVPQSRRLPSLATGALKALERTGPLARLALRTRFTYLVAAVR